MALSHNKNFLAVCERSEKAICSIYNMKTLKRKKVITTDHITDKEFISVAFSHQNEKGHLLTLSGGQDATVILWQWNKGKCIAYQKLGLSEGQTLYQASFYNLDFNSLIITGNGVYKYYKLKDNGLRPEHSTLAKKESHISNNYTCHTWLPEGKIIICTDQGELLLLESTGEYKMLLSCSPGDGFYIESITNYSKGFMIAGDTGQIMVFEKSDEPKKPFTHVATWPNVDPKEEKKYPELFLSIMASRIKCIALSSNDDTLVFSTANNQLMKVNVNLEKKMNESSIKYEYLIYPFHSRAISGLDVCIKKNLVATCSIDKTVRIWSYTAQSFKLDICETFTEEALSVAFHPSGYHIVVCFTDKIRMMNVFSEKKLSTFKEIPIKNCREIQFSNGGHLFACVNVFTIQVYNFYTGENLSSMVYNAHEGKVRCISWAEDDSYFISAGWDSKIYIWNIKNNNKPEYVFESKGTNFSCVAKASGKDSVYAVGTDKTIREIKYKVKEEKAEASVSAMISTEKETKYPLETKEKMRYESYVNFSQVCLFSNGKRLIVGTADDDKPGMVQVYNLDMEPIACIQAHSLPVERMKLSFDNISLFTTGQDGSFFMFEIKDSEYKIQYSEEILCEKAELRELLQAIEHLKRENDQLTQHKEMEQKRLEAENNEKIAKLKEDRDNNKRIAKEKHDQLAQEIADIEHNYTDEVGNEKEDNENELRRRMQDFEEKKEQDRIRYKEQEKLMKDEEEKIHMQMQELKQEHEDSVDKLRDDNEKELRKMSEMVQELSEKIKKMEIENKQTRDKLEAKYWEEIDEMKERNKNELYKQTTLGMDAKAELTMTKDKLDSAKSEKDNKEQAIKEKEELLANEIKTQRNLKSEIENQINEIAERKRTIADKETRIFQLKKKTQELEKFKFVLDYKIKELKRDINPKEAEIAKLNEQTTKMDQELKHFQRVNENLALIVDDLKMRQEGLLKEVKDQTQKLEQQESYIKKFNDDLFDCMNSIGNKKALKAAIVGLHKKYVLEEVKTSKGELDLQKEYAANRKYLERSVEYLRSMIAKDSTNHKQEYTRYMGQNVTLLQEINDLRKDVKTLDQQFRFQKRRNNSTMGAGFSQDDMKQGRKVDEETGKKLVMQDNLIQELTDELAALQEQNEQVNARARSSRGARNLPPIDRPALEEEAKKPAQVEEDDDDQIPRESERRLEDFKDDEEANKQDETQNQEEDEDNEEPDQDNQDDQDGHLGQDDQDDHDDQDENDDN